MKLLNFLKLTRWPSLMLFMAAAAAAVIFAFVTANLFSLAVANVEFVKRFGLIAIQHGALIQMAELCFWGTLSMLCWFVFKICGHILEGRFVSWSKED